MKCVLCVCVLCVYMDVCYPGDDSIETFFEQLTSEDGRITEDLKRKRSLTMTDDERQRFANASECWICNKPLNADRVRDHDHISGEFRGAAHNACNLLLRITPETHPIPVVFHNLKGYDAHMLISRIGVTTSETSSFTQPSGRSGLKKAGEIKVIPNNMEGYVSFCWGRFRFVDSLAFLNASLDKLVNNAPGESFKHLRSLSAIHARRMNGGNSASSSSSSSSTSSTVTSSSSSVTTDTSVCSGVSVCADTDDVSHPGRDDDDADDDTPVNPDDLFELLRRKGVYPYEYMDCTMRFGDTSLPPKEKFFSALSEKHISDSDYEHAQRVWTAFQCRTMGDYHDLYLDTDVNLLADVFETFRATAMGTYGLDPAHYYTLPGFAWDALLKFTGISLSLLSCVDMHLFIERGLRGGVSMASHRHAKANNRYVRMQAYK